jgi:diacylglycerol kinase
MPDTNNSVKSKFSIRERLRSFTNSFSGVRLLILFEHNFRIHLLVLLVVILAGILLKIPAAKWLVITVSAGMVLVSESLNTAIEYLSDAVSSEIKPEIRKAKDVAAAAVLFSAITSIIAGLIIFIPEIIDLFMQHS